MEREGIECWVDPTATVDPTTKVWHYAKILAHAKVGYSCSIGAGAEVGRNCRIGDCSRISSGVFLPRARSVRNLLQHRRWNRRREPSAPPGDL